MAKAKQPALILQELNAKVQKTMENGVEELKKALEKGIDQKDYGFGPGAGFPLKMENLKIPEFVTYDAGHISMWKNLQKGAGVNLVVGSEMTKVEDADGILTKLGMEVAHKYASKWVRAGARDLDIERQFPDLAGLFYDIRSDADLARMHAS
jgi:hypothetical protein